MADNFGLKIGVKGEKEFTKALADINQQFKVLSSEMKLATSQFESNEHSVESRQPKNEVLAKQIEAQKERIETLYSTEQAQMKLRIQELKSAIKLQMPHISASANSLERYR